MEINIKHPTNPNIVFAVKLINGRENTITIGQLLTEIDEVYITANNMDRKNSHARYWRLRNNATGCLLDNDDLCSSIDITKNNFSVVWGGH